MTEGLKFPDSSFSSTLERLTNLSDSDWMTIQMKCHKSCYSTFTSEWKLNRLHNFQNNEI